MGFHGEFDTILVCLPNNRCCQSPRVDYTFMTDRSCVIHNALAYHCIKIASYSICIKFPSSSRYTFRESWEYFLVGPQLRCFRDLCTHRHINMYFNHIWCQRIMMQYTWTPTTTNVHVCGFKFAIKSWSYTKRSTNHGRVHTGLKQ